MKYESSYECGRKPFSPDKERGKWSRPSDYIIVAIGLMFKMDLFTNELLYRFQIGPFGFLSYLITLLLYIVPIMVIQSFMGQFSSSSIISAFRLSPIFKGLGYLSILLNILTLACYSPYVVMPLYFLINSFRPTLPWSCESLLATDHENRTHHTCQPNGTFIIPGSAVYYYESYNSVFDSNDLINAFSWKFFLLNIVTWSLLAGVFYKFYKMPTLGKLLRNFILLTFVLLNICLIRFLFLSSAWENLIDYFSIGESDFLFSIFMAPIIGLASFGPGWGSIINLSSFNHFKTNIMNTSWIICLGQIVTFFAFSMTTHLIEGHIEKTANDSIVQQDAVLYFSSGSVLAELNLANLWSILFYAMLTMAALISMITQFMSLSTSLLDEYEILRKDRKRNNLILIGLLGLLSIITSLQVYRYRPVYFVVLFASFLCQSLISLILLFIVLWVYGRERFQHDIEFMTHIPFASWRIFVLRYISPLFLLHLFLGSLLYLSFDRKHAMIAWFIFGIVILVMPGYSIYILLQTTGKICLRWKRCCRPNDWYPVESDDRQRYEEALGNLDTTHQLHQVTSEIEA